MGARELRSVSCVMLVESPRFALPQNGIFVCLVGASNDAFGEIHNQPRLEYGMDELTLMSVSPLWVHC